MIVPSTSTSSPILTLINILSRMNQRQVRAPRTWCDCEQATAVRPPPQVVGHVPVSDVLMRVDDHSAHFVDPVRMSGSRYLAPEAPDSAQIKPEARQNFRCLDGAAWWKRPV
jgi:hypothetical protein